MEPTCDPVPVWLMLADVGVQRRSITVTVVVPVMSTMSG